MGANISPFVNKAKEIEKKYGIPASITLGQIILESSGTNQNSLSGLAVNAKNLFGIKGKGTAGSYASITNEFINGKQVTITDNFRKYNTFEESIEDYARLVTNERYSKFTGNAKNYKEFAYGLQAAGYATAPTYAKTLVEVIERNNLTQHDTTVTDTQPEKSDGFIKPIFTGFLSSGVKAILYLLLIIFAFTLLLKSFDIPIKI